MLQFFITLGVGYTVNKNVFLFVLFLEQFSTWNDKILGLGSKKKVCSALLWHYTFFFVNWVDLNLKSIKDNIFWHVAMILLSKYV